MFILNTSDSHYSEKTLQHTSCCAYSCQCRIYFVQLSVLVHALHPSQVFICELFSSNVFLSKFCCLLFCSGQLRIWWALPEETGKQCKTSFAIKIIFHKLFVIYRSLDRCTKYNLDLLPKAQLTWEVLLLPKE